MKSNEEIFQEALRGSIESLRLSSEAAKKVELRDENGKLKPFFWVHNLDLLNEIVDAQKEIMSIINSMISPYAETPNIGKKEETDTGEKWSADEILRHCTLEDNIIRLPRIQFNKKIYAKAKERIEKAGGTWKGGKVQGFTFPFNAERVFSILKTGVPYDLQKEFQFFETPPELGDWLVMLADGISESDSVLEPSAGRGALIEAIHRSCPNVIVDCYELMPENRSFLQKKECVRLLGENFTEAPIQGKYSKIIANPPFSSNQDIKHVRVMYELLQEGGTLAAITSRHWRMGSESLCIEFRAWLDRVGGIIYDIEEGEFKESGTGIGTCAVVIKKK